MQGLQRPFYEMCQEPVCFKTMLLQHLSQIFAGNWEGKRGEKRERNNPHHLLKCEMGWMDGRQ